MKITCQKCGKECIYFETENFGNVHLCQDCDKNDIEMISKELLMSADSRQNEQD